MTNHKCAVCDVADEDVRSWNTPQEYYAHAYYYECVAALQRERAQAKELLRDALPWLEILCEREDYDGKLPDIMRRIEEVLNK